MMTQNFNSFPSFDDTRDPWASGSGSENGNYKPVSYQGVEYDTLTECSEATQTSIYKIKKHSSFKWLTKF